MGNPMTELQGVTIDLAW